MKNNELAQEIASNQRKIAFQNDLIVTIQDRVTKISETFYNDEYEKKILLNKYLRFLIELENKTDILSSLLDDQYKILFDKEKPKKYEAIKINTQMRHNLRKTYGITR